MNGSVAEGQGYREHGADRHEVTLGGNRCPAQSRSLRPWAEIGPVWGTAQRLEQALRRETPSLRKLAARWSATVFWVTNSAWAISRFERSSDASRATRFARRERLDARDAGPAWAGARRHGLGTGTLREWLGATTVSLVERLYQHRARLLRAAAIPEGRPQVGEGARIPVGRNSAPGSPPPAPATQAGGADLGHRQHP